MFQVEANRIISLANENQVSISLASQVDLEAAIKHPVCHPKRFALCVGRRKPFVGVMKGVVFEKIIVGCGQNGTDKSCPESPDN